MPKQRILIIEDDRAIRQGLIDALQFAGYETLEAADGTRGLELAIKADCDLILLDLILPELDGLAILKETRAARPTLPVIILTARGEEDERVRGLRLGADDYVVKPFSVKELQARISAVLRRSPERPGDVRCFTLGQATVDLDRCEIRHAEAERCPLSEREAELLRYLARNRGRAISRDEILSRVWRLNPRAIVQTRAIDMHIARLREKLRDDPAAPRMILTVRGKGYMLAGAESGES